MYTTLVVSWIRTWMENQWLGKYKKLLCNALIQPDFDYSCIAWYPLISKEKTVSQSSKISACYTRILAAHIKEINLLPVELRVKLCTATTVFKYWNQLAPSIFLHHLLTDIKLGRSWNIFSWVQNTVKINSTLKTVMTTTTFTHALKKEILDKLKI